LEFELSSTNGDAAWSARSRLRAATADLHTELDTGLAPLIEHGDAGYARFLLRTAAALLPLEQALERANVATLLPDWSLRSRTQAIRVDLAELMLCDPPQLPQPEIRGEASKFGMLYVLEGSRLGSRLLLREAQARLSPAVRAATRYLSHGQGQPLWPTFLQRLETSPNVRRDPEQAAQGARAAFLLFLNAIGRAHPKEVVAPSD
jgi:heme oxygenase